MNSHEDFERWILEDEALPPDSAQQLSRHVAECDSCRVLQEGLDQSLSIIRNASIIKPAPGFMFRWQEQFAQRLKEKEESERIRLILAILGMLGLLSVSSCLVLFSPQNLVSTGLQVSNLLKLAAINLHQFKAMFSVIKTPLLILGAGSLILIAVYVLIGTLSAMAIKQIRKGA